MSNQRTIRPFGATFIGLSESIVQKCSTSFQEQVRNIGFSMLFTPFMSGALLCCSVAFFWQNMALAFLAFLCSFTLTLVYDRFFISTLKPLSASDAILRFLPVIAWIILHTLMIETVIFTSAIDQQLIENQVPLKLVIEDTYHSQVAVINSSIIENQDKINKINQNLKERGATIVLEIQGLGSDKGEGDGSIAKAMKVEQAKLETVVLKEEKQLLKQMDELKEEKKQALNEQKAAILALPIIQNLGPLERSKLLSQLIWTGENNFQLKAFALALMILIGFIEFMPFIGKRLVNFSEYIYYCGKEENELKALDLSSSSHARELEAIEMGQKNLFEKKKIRENYNRKWQEIKINAVINSLARKIETLEKLAAEEKASERGDVSRISQLSIMAISNAKKEIVEIFNEG